MGLRITPSMLYRTALADITRQRSRLADTQQRASSGLNINRPSDDPGGAGAAMLMRSGISAVAQFLRNNSNAASRVSAAESAVGNANDLMIRARELAIQGGNGSQSAESRAQIAREIETLHTALRSEANSSHGGGYLFAGFANDTPPFSVTGSFGDAPPVAPSVSFVGDPNPIELAIDQNETVQVTFDGARIFQGDVTGDGVPDGNRENLFDLLGDLRNALVGNDQAGVSATLGRFDTALNQLSAERTRIGAAVTQLETASDRLKSRQLNLEERLSTLQDADFAEVVSDLVQQEAALQAGLSAMARLVQPTLLDFLGLTMLVLTRKESEALLIGTNVRVVVLGVSGGNVRIGIEAPRDLTVLREEVHERVVSANRAAAAPASLDMECVAEWIQPQRDGDRGEADGVAAATSDEAPERGDNGS